MIGGREKIKLKILFLIFIIIVLNGCSLTGNVVKEGSVIKVDYTGSFENGVEFDSSVGKEPLTVTIGAGQVIKGFEDALIGMRLNEEKEVTVNPEEGYGALNPELIEEIPRKNIVLDNIEVGTTLIATDSNGNQIPATVIEVNDEIVKVDLNHPLAGKIIKFKIKIIEIK
ncbi:MAG: FKBP-type peptidyl-prolyl cis-trans isomerase [Nanoarchaeota archaeon]|nr:FKBP-type peptidyl-prolyl cis-trans isomerase [Nanoarchaeota archaeon]